MKRALLLGMIFIASLRAASAADVSGSWHVTGSVGDTPIDTTCTLAEKDGALSGTCIRKDKKSVDATGSVKGQNIQWHYNSDYNGDAISVNYSGTLGKDGTISGTIVVDPYNATGEFTATKK
jgi:opacity protein-like surface antigen